MNQTVNAVSHGLNSTIEKLTDNVEKLTVELTKSRNQCVELKQYSRRNNIISGIPESTSADAETQARTFLNDYAETSIHPNDIDRAHRITRVTRPSEGGKSTRPRDIIVNFCSHKSKMATLSREPMKQLKADNDDKDEKDRVCVREDLTKSRNSILYKARVLKRGRAIKDAFSRDGRIVPKLFMDKLVFLTTDDEFVEFCKDYKIKFVSPKAKDKNQTRAKSALRASHLMDIDKDSVSGGIQTGSKAPEAAGLDPNADSFTPTQNPMGMGPMTQDPDSEVSASPSLFDHLTRYTVNGYIDIVNTMFPVLKKKKKKKKKKHYCAYKVTCFSEQISYIYYLGSNLTLLPTTTDYLKFS